MIFLNWLFEEWLPVKGYEDLYEVSSFGRVRSLDHYTFGKNKSQRFVKGKVLCPSPGIYYTVILSKNGKTKTFSIHRLVAKAFIPNPNNLPCINHKLEFEKHNNCVWNLEWCDYSYNNTYGTKQDRLQNTRNEKGLNCAEKAVIQYSKDGKYIEKYKSSMDASRKTGIHQANINAVCRNKPHCITAGGFIWKYA